MSNQKTGQTIELNFSELATGSTTLNFGSESSVNHGYVVSQIPKVNIISQAHYKPPKSNTGQVTTNVNFSANIHALFDLNFIRSLEHSLKNKYQIAEHTGHLHHTEYEQSKSALLNQTIGFYSAKELNNGLVCQFENTKFLGSLANSKFEQAINLNNGISLSYQDNLHLKKLENLDWQEAKQRYERSQIDWIELDHKRKQSAFSYEVAEHIEQNFLLLFNDGSEVPTTNNVAWQEAHAIYYRKHNIEPWPTLIIPKYVGNADLDFQCLCINPDPHNIILNFGADDCIPQIAPQNGYYIVNTIKVSRLDTGEEIHVINGSVNCSRSQWCWNYSLTVPNQEIKKTQSTDGNPVILIIEINGNTHRMLVEDRSLSRQFANTVYTVTGRSPTALLDSPASATRTFLQENERTSVQLVQAEIDRADSEIRPDLNWQLIDDLGWVLPADSLSYSNLTPISAIKQITDAGGGFIYSNPDSNTLSIKPLYKKTYWDSLEMADYDRVISESVTTDISINDQRYPEYNAVYLTNDQTGNTGRVIRTGSAGDILQETQNNPLYTTASVMMSAGKALLAKAGLVEIHTFQMPLIENVGQCVPGEVLAFNGEWWGITDSVSIAFSYDKIMQTISVERVNQNE